MKSPRDLLEDILIESEFLLQRGFARSIEIIGEAVKGLPNDLVLRYPDIQWRRIAGMRDRLIHGYFAVDYALVFDVVKTKIPELDLLVRKMLAEYGEPL